MDTRRTKHALVIGARGVLGALTVQALRTAGWTVRSGTRRPGPRQIEIDLDRRDSVAGALRARELVVNTVPHPDLLAERHVLEHGGTLINVSALPAAAARALRAVAGGARGTVLMNTGLAPGVTTLAAADLLRLHPEADELEIVFTLALTSQRGLASADFIHRGLAAAARHRTSVVPLPIPFGQRRCLGFAEEDAGWLGGFAEGRVVRQYVCVAEPAVHQRLLEINSAGEMHDLPRSAVAPRKPHGDLTGSDEPVAHWIAATRAGRRLCAHTVQCRGAFVHAARCAVVFADVLHASPRPGGCFGPEEICMLSGVAAKLRAVGVTIVARQDLALGP